MAALMLRAAWAYRGFIVGSVKREFQAKYGNAVLGAAWAILNPLAMILVYTVIFSQVMRSKLPGVDTPYAYSIYLCAGILTWGLFAEICSRALTMFIEQANLLKKISFPRICLPLIVVASAVLNFAIIFGLFILFLLATGHFPGWVLAAVIPLLLLQIALSIGLGLILGVLNVFFRDIGQFFTIALQFWFWLTPIVYAPEILPPEVRGLLVWNPMAPVIAGYQNIFVSAQAPHWASLWPTALLALLLCAIGLQLFRRRAGELVDEL